MRCTPNTEEAPAAEMVAAAVTVEGLAAACWAVAAAVVVEGLAAACWAGRACRN